jgi:hypothetical protein
MELQSKKYLDDILYAATLIEEFLAGKIHLQIMKKILKQEVLLNS